VVTQEEEHALSAIRHLDLVHRPIIIGYGDKESPEFQRHGRDFATALKRAGIAHELHIGLGLNHFEVMHSMSEPNGFFRTLALRLVGATVPASQAEDRPFRELRIFRFNRSAGYR
jgi:arylformamidase